MADRGVGICTARGVRRVELAIAGRYGLCLAYERNMPRQATRCTGR